MIVTIVIIAIIVIMKIVFSHLLLIRGLVGVDYYPKIKIKTMSQTQESKKLIIYLVQGSVLAFSIIGFCNLLLGTNSSDPNLNFTKVEASQNGKDVTPEVIADLKKQDQKEITKKYLSEASNEELLELLK